MAKLEASEWLAGRRGELRPRTIADYEWGLSYHLLPALGALRVNEIGILEVDRYKAAKLSEGKLGPPRSTRPSSSSLRSSIWPSSTSWSTVPTRLEAVDAA